MEYLFILFPAKGDSRRVWSVRLPYRPGVVRAVPGRCPGRYWQAATVYRASYKWKRECARRTAVERVNSQLDVPFGFEVHPIRRMAKMEMRCGLALCVMLAMALGRTRRKQATRLKGLVAA